MLNVENKVCLCNEQETADNLYVNSTRSMDLHVSFDISFPNVACKLLSLDVVDDLGAVVKDSKHEIFKHRLDKKGVKHGDVLKEQLGNSITSEDHILEGENIHPPEELSPNKCGNCYGAGRAGECCNTCDDVRRAYKRMGWTVKMHEVEQCRAAATAETLKEQYAESGGCQVYGTVELHKAAGHFHIVPHNNIRSLKTAGRQGGIINLMDLLSFTFDQFNISHTVNSLSFGHPYPGMANPLDGEQRHVKDTHGMYQYYVKIVPTSYLKLDGTEIESNQYSVTEHLRHLAPGSGRGMPGVYFYYQVSPISAKIVEKRKPFLEFLTSTCAIIGGTFTVMGIMDILLSNALSLFNKSLL